MIIGICGLGFSGSGAVLDLLREYDDIDGFSNCEMSICYYPDGIEDLDYHLNVCYSRYMSSDAAIYSFLRMMKARFEHNGIKKPEYAKKIMKATYDYIDAITQVRWKGTWGYREYVDGPMKSFIVCNILQRLSIYAHRLFKINIQLAPLETMRLSIKPEEFDMLTKEYLIEVLKAIGFTETSKKFVVDQLFSGDNPEKSFKYFSDPCAIVVRRDPRDVYLLAKKVVKVHASWIPTENVEAFIEYYRRIYSGIKDIKSDKVLILDYEDLIYRYDECVNRIESFLSINKHTNRFEHFDPKHSIRYTQLFDEYPEHKDEISKIESSLSRFLYHYPYKRDNNKITGRIIV